MKLTKNEKKVLELLLENARITDSAIANQLRISSQAVGKIRRKLENTLIDSYTVNLSYAKLGIHTFALSLAKITNEGMEKGELEVEEKLIKNPNIIQVHRLPSGNFTHVLLYGFRNTEELDNFFHSSKTKKELHNFIDNKELFIFSHHSLIKNNPLQLFHEIINSKNPDNFKDFIEIQNFKKKLK